MPNVTGNEDMSCPEKRRYALADHISRGPAPAWWSVARRVCESRVLQFMRCERQKAQSRHRLITDGAVCRSLPVNRSAIPHGIALPHSFSQTLRVLALRRSSPASVFACRTLLGGPGPLTLTPERVSNVQQNVNRRVAPRRNQGGRCSR